MINLFNIMDSVEQEEIALKKASSILMAVNDAMQYTPHNSDYCAMAVCAAVDIVKNTEVMLEVLRDGISNHLQAEHKNIANAKGGAR